MGWKVGKGCCADFNTVADVATAVHPLLWDAEEIGWCVHRMKQFMNTQPWNGKSKWDTYDYKDLGLLIFKY